MDTINETKPVILTLFILIAVSGVINAELNFIDPTLPNGSEIYINHTTINVSIDTPNLSSMVWNWNGTNTTFLNDSCVLHMSFDNNSEIGDSSTVVRDVSSYNNNGSFTNGSTGNWTADGKWNGAMSFDGVNDWIGCGNDPSLNITDAITIGMWTKFVSGEIPAVEKRDSYLMYYNGGTWVYGRCFPNFSFGYDGVTADDNWHYLAYTYHKNIEQILYLDGSILSSANVGDISIAQNANNLKIGILFSGYRSGTIDEVRIYNRALSPAEVRQSYLSNLWKYNASRWYFETKQTGLPYGEHNYQAFANNLCSEYRILIISILRPTTLFEESNLICYEISNELSDINMSNYLVYAFILMGILLIILGIQIITNNIKR